MIFSFNLTQADALWTVAAAFGTFFLLWLARAKIVFGILRKIYNGIALLLSFPAIMQKRMDDQDAKLKEITEELTPNGGGSIKDVVGKINELVLLNALRTRQMIMTHSVAIYECEPKHGLCIMANKALCELFGLSEEEMLGNGWIKAIVPRDRQACWDGYQKAIASDIPYDWSYVVQNQRTRECYKCSTEMVVLRDGCSKAIVYQGIVEKRMPVPLPLPK